MTDTEPIRVLLVTGQDPVSTWLISVLRAEPSVQLVDVAHTLEQAALLIGQRPIDVVLVDSVVPDAQQLDRLQAIAAQPGSPATLIMVANGEMQFVQQAMLAGARGFLLKPFTLEQLVESVRQAHAIITQQRQAVGLVTFPVATQRTESAEIVALFSPKGGVGRTALATNLAIALHQESHKRVILIDGDLQFGDIDVAVNVIARKSIADLLPYADELEASLIDSALIDHASGVQLLLAPPMFNPTLEEAEGHVAHVVKSLATFYSGYLVVDAPAGLGEATLGLLDAARFVLLVTTASLATLRATKRFLRLARTMDYSHHKLKLVVSGYSKDDLPLADIERHLDWPVTMVVPGDPVAMKLALNQGQPIIMRDRGHPISKAIVQLARYLDTGSTGSAAQSSDMNRPSSVTDKGSEKALPMNLKPDRALGR